MKVKKRLIIIVFLVLLLGVGAYVYLGQRNAQVKETYYSGTIEARSAELSFQVSGRVVEILADEGERVEKDMILAKLDQSEYQ
ncbi:MAG: biotin/lipoyl-binding protein, partial [Deltaproteobacteria bacterium]